MPLRELKGEEKQMQLPHTLSMILCPLGRQMERRLLFPSNRYGNYDIFTMPSIGGSASRLTHHSSDDYPSSIDGAGHIYFSSSRLTPHLNSQFPSGVLSELYSIHKDGELHQVLTTPAESALWNKDKTKLIYHDRVGYENAWRNTILQQ